MRRRFALLLACSVGAVHAFLAPMCVYGKVQPHCPNKIFARRSRSRFLATAGDSSQSGIRGTVTQTKNQFGKLLTAAPSLAALVGLNIVTSRLFKQFGLEILPPPLVGMFALFFTLIALKDETASKVVTFFKPGVDLVTRFLPMFFVPALVVLPLSASAIAGLDALKGLGMVVAGMVACYAFTALITVALERLVPAGEEIKDVSTPLPAFSLFLQQLFTASTVLSFLAAVVAGPAHPGHPALPAFMLSSTLASFIAGSRLPARLPPAANRVIHPLMSTTVFISACLGAYAAAAGVGFNAVLRTYLVPGGAPLAGAGNLVMYGLGPAIWSFAFGLYARRRILLANLVPILGGTWAAAAGGIATMAALSRLFAPTAAMRLALLPRATAALAVIQAGMIGASAPLVTAGCVVTGVLGANFGRLILDGLGVTSPCARGVATGGSGFSLGAAALAKDDPDAFPFGALAMALMSTWATILFALPPVRGAVLDLAGVSRAGGAGGGRVGEGNPGTPVAALVRPAARRPAAAPAAAPPAAPAQE